MNKGTQRREREKHGNCETDKKHIAIFVKTKKENSNDSASDFRKGDTV